MINKINNIIKYNLAPSKISPSSFTAVLTGRCNLKCQTCNFWKSHISEMSTYKWKHILSQFADMGFKHASFTGGEPLLRRDLFELTKFAKNKNISIGLQTNGVLIDKYIDKINLFESITISLDSLKIHDKIRGIEGTLKKVKKNIEILIDKGSKVGIRVVVQADNYLELEEITDYCEKTGVDNLEFLYIRKTDNQFVSPQYNSVFDMNTEKLKLILKKICKKKIVNNDYSYFDLCLKRSNGPVIFPCIRPYEGVMVHPDGKVFPCCGNLPSVGNLNDSSLRDIWNSYSHMRKLAYKCEIDICKICTSPNIQRNYNFKKIIKKKVLKIT